MDHTIRLHDYLLQHANEMTQQWLDMEAAETSIEQTDASKDMEETLKEQIHRLVELLIGSLTEEPNGYAAWINEVAAHRVQSQTALHQSLGRFRRVRTIFWSYITAFAKEQNISVSELGDWGEKINHIIDQVIEQFAIGHTKANKELLHAQKEMITELSSPVIPVSPTIGILPLVGDIDEYRAKVIKENTLDQGNKLHLDYLVIDLSGVPYMDTMVAHELYGLSDMLSLIGIEPILTGISPSIAQTSVHLGLEFRNISIYNTLQQALPILLKKEADALDPSL